MRFEVESIDALCIDGPPDLLRCELMSPFAWSSLDGNFHLLIRAVPPADANDPVTGRIWYGEGEPDGCTFRMDDKPVHNALGLLPAESFPFRDVKQSQQAHGRGQEINIDETEQNAGADQARNRGK